MKVQTIAEMIEQGATEEEARQANNLFQLLRPCLKVNKVGRFDTTAGDKTVLGLYRTLKHYQSTGAI